jgi:protein-disulfide isomerase
MKRYLPFIIVTVVALATLVSGALLYRAKRPKLLTIPKDKIIQGKPDTASMHIRGEPEAPVTLEEFGDYQCPPCRTLAAFLDDVLKDYHPKLRIVFRNFPLQQHKHAREAAAAAEAAGAQGKFWEMHDLLYREQDVWSKAANTQALFDAYAGTLGLDLEQFKKDKTAQKTIDRIASDEQRGLSIGVKSTPTLFLNEHEIGPDDRTPDGVRKLLDAAVKGQPIPWASPSPSATASPASSQSPAAITPSPAASPAATTTPKKK